MKKLVLFVLLIVSVNLFSQTTTLNDTINNNIVFSDTVFLTSDVFIDTGVTISFLPGTKVIATGNYGFYVKGNIIAIGTEQDSILFTRDDTTFFNDVNRLIPN